MAHERVLLIGDEQRDVQTALMQAVPGAHVTSVPTLFDGIAELCGGRFTTVLAAAEPLERRPEAAVRTLREVAGDARLLLFGHPTLEILSRKMLEFGCDDYVITPPNPDEFPQILGTPPLRIAPASAETEPSAGPAPESEPAPSELLALDALPLADILLESMLQNPQDSLGSAVRDINARISPRLSIQYTRATQAAPAAAEGRVLVSHPIRNGADEAGALHLLIPPGEDEAAARHALAPIAQLIGKLAALQERHNRLQRLAITDELTGLYNARYFRHFLSLILERARKMHFPVTLLMFDIDNFKK
ncbi:MAG TPA: GGDEF domain-containing protein, partial [Tepidisphaeraceae bacterium]|nr:GGDEF domain-containing protein [Tepidisphaeraceae bacterium]